MTTIIYTQALQMRTCSVCPALFNPRQRNARTCSTECSLQWQKVASRAQNRLSYQPSPEKACAICEGGFIPYGHHIRTCSKSCAKQWKIIGKRTKSKLRIVVCSVCNVLFESAYIRGAPKQYCSSSCRWKARYHSRIARGLCPNCGKTNDSHTSLVCNVCNTYTIELSRRTRRLRIIEPIPQSWPFLSTHTCNVDGAELLQTVDRLVPAQLPHEIREDLCQELVLSILAGQLSTDNLATVIPQFIKSTFKEYPSKYGDVSIDMDLTGDGFRLVDILGGKSKTVGLCDRCETFSDALDNELCAPCYAFLERQLTNQSVEQASYQAKSASKKHNRVKREGTNFTKQLAMDETTWWKRYGEGVVLKFE